MAGDPAAFQEDAFQNDAFQTGEDATAGGGPGKFGLRSLFVVEEEDEDGVVLPLTLDPF